MKKEKLLLRYDALTGDEHISKTISVVRFPLIVLVVFIHSYILMPYHGSDVQASDVPVFYNIEFLLSEIIACIAVPLFFLISGFLFFYHLRVFNRDSYISKVKKRFKSLFVPYLFWSFSAVIVTLIVQLSAPSLLSGEAKGVITWTVSDWITAIWGGQFPHNIPLWFLRDLMVVVVFSPLVYLAVKYLKMLGLIVLCLLYVGGICVSWPGFSITSLFFFMVGAYFGIYNVDFVRLSEKFLPFFISVFFFLTLLLMIDKEVVWFNYLKSINNIVGIFSFVGITSYFVRKGMWKSNNAVVSSSFLIYVYHGIFSERVLRFFFLILNPRSEMTFVFIYFATALILVTGGILIYNFFNKVSPKFTSLITGSR